MKKYSDLEYLKLSKWERFKYRFVSFFASIPVAIPGPGAEGPAVPHL